MTIKHERAFGPALLDIWNLDDMKEQVLERWNQFNLYEITRGINRFQGLEKCSQNYMSKVALLMAIMILRVGRSYFNILKSTIRTRYESASTKKGLRLALDWSKPS